MVELVHFKMAFQPAQDGIHGRADDRSDGAGWMIEPTLGQLAPELELGGDGGTFFSTLPFAGAEGGHPGEPTVPIRRGGRPLGERLP